MGRLEYERKIYERLWGKPHLRPLFTNVCHVPERIREYNPDFFVVFNRRTGYFEVHSLAHVHDTYGLTIYTKELYPKALDTVRRNDIRMRGKAIFRELDKANERFRESEQRATRNELRAIAEEMKPYFARFAWDQL